MKSPQFSFYLLNLKGVGFICLFVCLSFATIAVAAGVFFEVNPSISRDGKRPVVLATETKADLGKVLSVGKMLGKYI